MRDEVEDCACDGEWRATCSDAGIGDHTSAFFRHKLYACWKTKLVASTGHEVLRARRAASLEAGRVVEDVARPSADLLILLQECFQGWEQSVMPVSHLADH